MGPMAIFDKSFLHSLNMEEAAVFDVLFMSNIAPVFFIETLADLEKEVRGGRSPEQVVGNLAAKTPKLHSYPNLNHWVLCWTDLLGTPIEMDRKPKLGGGRAVEVPGKTGLVFDVSAEMLALQRWQKGDFLGVERDFAKGWRPFISSVPQLGRFTLADGKPIKFGGLDQVLQFANHLTRADGRRWKTLKLAMDVLALPESRRKAVVERWKSAGGPPLHEFAPYAAFVFTLDVFFELARAAGMISDEPTHRIEQSYLYYLPFGEIFISGDKLHRETAPLLMAGDQRFVWGPDLKRDLTVLAQRYAAHPDLEKEGLIRIAALPPLDGDFLVSRLYDALCPGWREAAARPREPANKAPPDLIAQIDALTRAPTTKPQGSRPDAVVIERDIPVHFGKLRFVPEGAKSSQKAKTEP
jgi:hypothetical protein